MKAVSANTVNLDVTALNVLQLATRMADNELSAEAVVRGLAERISEREPVVKAWSFFDPELALAGARALDAVPRRGPFHGIPVAVKDVIDTADMPTAYGSPIYEGHRPQVDAAPVATTRAAGGLIFGKTVTAEFAHREPGQTRNPLDLERTPGGSSSGSAAAVADGMVPIALATQTTASTIRPASYCGLVGYRPSFGIIGCQGVKESAPSLDSIGLIGRSVSDCALFRDVLLEVAPRLPSGDLGGPPRIGFSRTPFWALVEPAAAAVLERTVAGLSRHGAVVSEVDTPKAFDAVAAAHRCISSYELAQSLAAERREHFDKLSVLLREGRLAAGCQIDASEYIAAVETLEQARQAAKAFFSSYDCVICPSTAGIAPIGINSTGPSEFCILWTALHVPSLTVPISERIEGMPLGLQVVAGRGRDVPLFDCAKWIETRI
jgi:Asp-tRNA(Asn)/Glu-tRNA(Gln) amidotransferase A subunit family amidase